MGDDVDSLDDRARLAERMTELGIDRCQHGRQNRCPLCGIERDRDVTMGADGTPQWSVAWKPIGAPSSRTRGDEPAPSPGDPGDPPQPSQGPSGDASPSGPSPDPGDDAPPSPGDDDDELPGTIAP